ncbi:MAG: hypothetical protein EA407_03855 [Rhodobacteraceae bacterium]|nr:MAG: hypothetical protein EA407_03855 [Paracoccaceae bacterium]
MRSKYSTLLQALILGTALGVAPVVAQDATDDIGILIELARNDAAQDIVALPGSALADILGAASQDQLEELVGSLAAEDVDAILASLALTGADPRLQANMVSAVITSDPEATARIIDVILQNSPLIVLPDIAQGLYELIERVYADMSLAVFEGHVLAAVTFDRRIAGLLVELGNTWDTANAARLARALVTIAEDAEADLASAIETALALAGGQMLQLAAEFRDEIDVAAIPDPAPPPPAAPGVPPAGIGGGGASPAGTGATAPGRDAIFAAGGGTGTGLGSGPSFTPRGQRTDRSPTN